MKQRTAVLLTTALTALVLAVTLGVAGAMSLRSQVSVSDQAAPDPTATEDLVVPEITATATPPAATDTPPVAELAVQADAIPPADGQQSSVQPELVSYEGTPAYEIRYDGGVMYVDARTGVILYDTQLAAMAAQFEMQASAEQSGQAASSREYFESHDEHEEHDRD